MAPRVSKTKTKANVKTALKPKPNQIPVPISDYESDINNLPPPGPPRTNADLNFSVLQRHLPSITSILYIAPYSVIYIFSNESQSWEKSGIEGTLFVCSLSPLPSQVPSAERFAAILLNRQGLDNFVLELTSARDVEIAGEFIIMRNGAQVWGVWVFEEAEPSSTSGLREELGTLLKMCTGRLEEAKGNRDERDRVSISGNDESKDGTRSMPNSLFPSKQQSPLPIPPSFLNPSSILYRLLKKKKSFQSPHLSIPNQASRQTSQPFNLPSTLPSIQFNPQTQTQNLNPSD